MKSDAEISFGEYIKAMRTADDRSLRQTAIAIGVTPQYFSDVEKHNRSGFTPERLESLAIVDSDTITKDDGMVSRFKNSLEVFLK